MIEKEPSCEAIKKVEFDFEHKRMSKVRDKGVDIPRDTGITPAIAE